MGWMVNGKELNYEEYGEYLKQQATERGRTQDEIQRRINEVSDAFTACQEFIEQHPEVHYELKDAQAREHDLYLKLRLNLERAAGAPRCEKVREDGTVCGSPQMKGYRYCYAHERMLAVRSSRLELPALEDANAVQMAIMRVQKALIDDEISEKKAGLLLYSLQMASSNLKKTTFTDSKKEVVTEMPVSPTSPTTRVIAEIGKQVLPLINTDDTDRNKPLPRINADDRGSENRSAEAPELKSKTAQPPIRLRSGQATDTKGHKGENRVGHGGR
jgi:hypothetical protein